MILVHPGTVFVLSLLLVWNIFVLCAVIRKVFWFTVNLYLPRLPPALFFAVSFSFFTLKGTALIIPIVLLLIFYFITLWNFVFYTFPPVVRAIYQFVIQYLRPRPDQ